MRQDSGKILVSSTTRTSHDSRVSHKCYCLNIGGLTRSQKLTDMELFMIVPCAELITDHRRNFFQKYFLWVHIWARLELDWGRSLVKLVQILNDMKGNWQEMVLMIVGENSTLMCDGIYTHSVFFKMQHLPNFTVRFMYLWSDYMNSLQ